jgi:hypothetical protein
LVAIALFAPGVLAPKLALSDKEVGAFATAVFATGASTSLYGGLLALSLRITASRWNRIFLAEVARLAPSGRFAEATGAVLMASYTGLLAGPSVVAGLAAAGTLALSYAGLAGLTVLATLTLIGARR